MAPHGDYVSGIEISREHISIAQYSPSERTVVNASLVLRPFDDEETSADNILSLKTKLKKLLSDMNAGGQDAYISLPSNLAIVKKLTIDKSDDNVRQAIEWELSQQIIGSMDEYVFDYEALAGSSDGLAQYIAVAYKNKTLQEYVALVKSARQRPCVVDIDSFALVNVFEANYPEATSSPAVIVHGSDDSTNVILTQNRTFIDCESVDHRAYKSSGASYAAFIRDLIAQNFVSLGDAAVSCQVFVTGALFSHLDFTETVLSGLGQAQVLDPFAKISSSFKIPEKDMQKCIPHLAVCVGLALRAEAGAV